VGWGGGGCGGVVSGWGLEGVRCWRGGRGKGGGKEGVRMEEEDVEGGQREGRGKREGEGGREKEGGGRRRGGSERGRSEGGRGKGM